MPARSAIPTFEELLQFAMASEDVQFQTLTQGKSFHVFVKAGELYFRPRGQIERRSQTTRVNEMLMKVQSTDSWKPGDYAGDTFNASYLLALVQAWRSGESGTRFPVPARVTTQILTEDQKEALKSAVRSAVRHRDCAIREDRLIHGFQVHNRSALKNQWIGSVYWSENNPGNDVELAFDLRRLADRIGEADQLTRWFEVTARQLQSHKARNHSGDNEVWFRAGFNFADALDFFSRLAKNTNPLTSNRERWIVEDGPAPRPEPTQDVEPPAASGREDKSLDHMLAMAKQACEQSGEVRTSVAKVKTFMFDDDTHFRLHVAELLARQENRCAITNLPLQFAGDWDDEERLASLDRIDSNGDYAPNNLQVVCRFVNRWKSDDSDENFRRLIELVRR